MIWLLSSDKINKKYDQKIVKASKEVSEKGIKHFLMVIKADGNIECSWSEGIVQGVIDNAELFSSLESLSII